MTVTQIELWTSGMFRVNVVVKIKVNQSRQRGVSARLFGVNLSAAKSPPVERTGEGALGMGTRKGWGLLRIVLASPRRLCQVEDCYIYSLAA